MDSNHTSDGKGQTKSVIIYEERLHPIGGNQRHISLLVKYATTANLDILVVTPRAGDLTTLVEQVDPTAVMVLGCTKGIFGYLQRLYKLTRLILKKRPLVLLCNETICLLPTILPAALTGTPVIWQVKVTTPNKWWDFFARFFTKRVLLISEHVLDKKSKWVRKYFYNDYHVLPIGIELDRFLKVEAPSSASRFRVLVISRIHPFKGLDLLIEAIRMLADKSADIEVKICGGIPTGRETYARQLEASMASLPYRNIEYLGWHEDVIPFLKSADLVLLPSRAEGVPRSLVEAMAAGRPVLATNVGGIPDLVIDGETGFLVPVDDAEQLAEKLIWFRDHPVERRQMGQKARAYVENKHDIKTHVELLAQHIRRVSKARPDT